MTEVLPVSPISEPESSSTKGSSYKFWQRLAIVFIVLFIIATIAAVVGIVVVAVTKKKNDDDNDHPSPSVVNIPIIRELFLIANPGKSSEVLDAIRYFVGNTPGINDARIGKPGTDYTYTTRNYDYSLFITFTSKEALIEYETDPVHLDFIGKFSALGDQLNSPVYENEIFETVGDLNIHYIPYIRELFFVAKPGKADALLEDIRYFIKNTPGIYTAHIGRPGSDYVYTKKDYDFSLLVTFTSKEALIAYEKDPVHWDFVDKFGELGDLPNSPVYENEIFETISGKK